MADAALNMWPAMTQEQKDRLEGFTTALPITDVDRAMGWRVGTTRTAIEQGKMRFIRRPGKKRMLVTPQFVIEYIDKYCTFKNEELPGEDVW